MLKFLSPLTSCISPIGLAVTLSLALHGLGFSINFVPPPSRQIHNQGLEVVLVNHSSKTKPKNAQALAQANLDGGGNAEKGLATTPLPPTKKQQSGDDIEKKMRLRVRELEEQQQALAAKNSQFRIKTREYNPEQPSPGVADGLDLTNSSRELSALLAAIDKRQADYNKRPRPLFLGASTQEIHSARYFEDWRQKVERVGTLNYPAAAKGKFHGSLILTVVIDRNGNVVKVEIDRSSGNKILDDAARRIVYLASPYPALPPAILKEYDQLSISRTWEFTPGNRLETKDTLSSR